MLWFFNELVNCKSERTDISAATRNTSWPWSRMISWMSRGKFCLTSDQQVCYALKWCVFAVCRIFAVKVQSDVHGAIKACWHYCHHQEPEDTAVKHHWAWLWVVGSAAQPGGPVSQTVSQGSSRRQDSVWAKRRLTGSAGDRWSMQQVSESLATDSPATCCKSHYGKWRYEGV